MVIGSDVAGGLGVPSPMPTPTGPLVIRNRGMPSSSMAGHVPLDPDLVSEFVHVLGGLWLCRQVVDVDRLHRPVELRDLLLHRTSPDRFSAPPPGDNAMRFLHSNVLVRQGDPLPSV